LGKADRNAVVLRFFQNKSAREIAVALNVHESAAQKRLNRAVEKLRAWFLKRGVAVSGGALTGALSIHSVHGAPAHLAASVMAVSAKETAVSSSTLTLIKGALKIMAWTKMKTAIVAGACVLLAGGTATITVKEIQARRTPIWQEKYDEAMLDKLPPQVAILPSLPSRRPAGIDLWSENKGKILAFGHSIEQLAMVAYPGNFGQLIISAPIPKGKYDYIVNLPSGQREALQKEMKRKFGLVGRRELMETNVLILTVRSANAAGLKESRSQTTFSQKSGFVSSHGQTILAFVDYLRRNLGTIVIDRTGLHGSYDIDLKWDSTPEGLKRAVREQLGLELEPKTETVEFYIIEKAK
jgi:uncharacterized protein (TIGR03435 family)